MTQLMIYTGIFFFEYGEIYKPTDLRTVLRIYQNDAIERIRTTAFRDLGGYGSHQDAGPFDRISERGGLSGGHRI
jgi:hypothetical protein